MSKVMSWDEWLAKYSLSRSTGWRLRQTGDGPRITKLSERRIGVADEDDRAWFESRKKGI